VLVEDAPSGDRGDPVAAPHAPTTKATVKERSMVDAALSC